ncbi:MAG: hypothetical protein HYU64_19030 [Armatimonadetes bacterium]|nr:hypothetical protein [Armatimonadota bacterium]
MVAFLLLWPFIVRGAEPLRIDASDIASGKVEIVGRLGLPLGRIARVKGRFVDGTTLRMKDYDGITLMKVTAADGKELKGPATFRFENLPGGTPPRTAPGAAFDVQVYETGRYVGVPSEAFKYVPAVTTTDHYFETYLMVLK